MTALVVFVLAAAVAGASHALLLAHGVRKRAGVSSSVARFLLTPAVLVVAARSGAIVPSAIAWAVAFAIVALVLHRRMA